MSKIEIKKEDLQKLFVEEKKKIIEIANIYNCSRDTITRRLVSYGLKEGKIREKIKTKRQEDIEKTKLYIVEQYKLGRTFRDIGEEIGLSEKTVGYHYRSMGEVVRSSKKVNQEDFEKLWNEGKSDLEIAEFFNVEESTIKSYRTKGKNAGKFKRTNYFSESGAELTEIQEQFILGSLLGDLAIDLSKGMTNAKLCLVHSIKQEELFMKKVEILGEFMGNYKLYTPAPDKRTGKVYQTWRGNSKTHPIFNEFHKLLYPNRVKTITMEYLNKINNPIALAYWFMDDGTYRGQIATNCFTEKEVDLLMNWLYNTWNIKCTKQKNKINYTIYITAESRLDFERLIFPYIIPSMYYKLKYVDILKEESV